MSDELKSKVIEVAMRNLRLMGCKFVVVKPDGTIDVHGDLELAVPSTKVKRKRLHNFAATGYLEIIKAMKPGEDHLFEIEGDYTPGDYQKAVSASASRLLGKNNFMTSCETNGVRVVCLGRLDDPN